MDFYINFGSLIQSIKFSTANERPGVSGAEYLQIVSEFEYSLRLTNQ